MNMFFSQNGRSMVEMLGVLAIIGVLSIGGLAGYQKAMFKYKMNQTISVFSQVLQNFVELSQKNWEADTELWTREDIVKYGLLSAEMCPTDYADVYGEEGQACKLPLGEFSLDVALGGYSVPYGEFYITFYEGDVVDSCVAFLSHGWEKLWPEEWKGNYDWSGPALFRVAGPALEKTLWTSKKDWAETSGGKTEISLTDIREACSVCQSGSYCQIELSLNGEL